VGNILAMVKLNRIYTRKGDAGDTVLVSGPRRAKHDARVVAIGEVDEANAAIGLARLPVAGWDAVLDAELAAVQNDLFDLGADLATPEEDAEHALRVAAARISWLERRIDAMNAHLEPLRSFVLPAGSPAAAHLHFARAVVRRAERAVSALKDTPGEWVNPQALAYLNRLSDYLFVMARLANRKAGGDVLWQPVGSRGQKEDGGET
jgi:cob(I)alamin adenosyltransferase